MTSNAFQTYQKARSIIANKQKHLINDSLIKDMLMGYDDQKDSFSVLIDILELLGEDYPSKSMYWMWQIYQYGYGHEETFRKKIPQMLEKASSNSPIRGAMYSALLMSESNQSSFFYKHANKKLLSCLFNIASQSSNPMQAPSLLKECMDQLNNKQQKDKLYKDGVGVLIKAKLNRIGIDTTPP